MNGGYIMIKASDADIYASASKALNIGKPILFYENATTCYYIDSITLDGDGNIVLTKGGKTITIADDNTITSVGDIQVKKTDLFRYLISLQISFGDYGSNLALDIISDIDLELSSNNIIEQIGTLTENTIKWDDEDEDILCGTIGAYKYGMTDDITPCIIGKYSADSGLGIYGIDGFYTETISQAQVSISTFKKITY